MVKWSGWCINSWWYHKMRHSWGYNYHHNHHLLKLHLLTPTNWCHLHILVKHHTHFVTILYNQVYPEVCISIPCITTHVPLLWHNSSSRSMIITFLIYITQSLDQMKLTIPSVLNVLSSGKLFSQKILVDYLKVLLLARKVEMRTYFYNKKSSANWTKIHVCKYSMPLSTSKIIPLSRHTNH